MIPAIVNVRESAITMLASRKKLDLAQVEATNHFRKLYEALGGKGASGFDPGRLVVDGGKMPDGISQRQINAGQELRKCRAQAEVIRVCRIDSRHERLRQAFENFRPEAPA